MRMLRYSALGLLLCLPLSAHAQQPFTSFTELEGSWVNGSGAQVRIDEYGSISTFTGGKGLSGRTYVGATTGGGNFAFMGKTDSGEDYECDYNIIFTNSGAAVWDVVGTSGTHACPRGTFLKSHYTTRFMYGRLLECRAALLIAGCLLGGLILPE
jgi:hypothetical protein